MIVKSFLVLALSLSLFMSLSFRVSAQPPVSESQLLKAEKILAKRGFSKYAIVGLLHGHVFRLTYRHTEKMKFEEQAPFVSNTESLVEKLRKRYGVESPSVILYSEYEPDTGRAFKHLSLLDFAKTVTSCMARNRPWRDCVLNYHPIDGCFLTPAQRRQCFAAGNGWGRYQSTGEWGDLNPEMCWNYAKGPGIILPYQTKVKSQIDLAKAVRLEQDEVAQSLKSSHEATGVKRLLSRPPNFLGRPRCQSALSQGPSCLGSAEGC